MSLLAAVAGSLGQVLPITASSDWGSNSGTAPTTITSAARTLTVPSGNPGNLTLNYVDGGAGGTPQYSKNAGAFTTFSNGTGITVANGDTLQFRCQSVTGSAATNTTTVVDATKGTTVGEWFANTL